MMQDPLSAVLLLDLQFDFLDERGKMPVTRHAADAVICAANAILAGQALQGALPVLIVNRFPPTERVANLFRRGAAVEGSAGAELDARVGPVHGVPVFAKRQASAFSNPELAAFLRGRGVDRVFVCGVMAEACVRATVASARRNGFHAYVLEDAIATRMPWLQRMALWAMERAGAKVARVFRNETVKSIAP